jgi:acyl-CoA dehydrogenase
MTEAKPMDLGITKHLQPILEAVRDMVRNEIIPLDEEFLAEVGFKGDRWSYTPRQTEILEGLKAKARERGLWNLWRTHAGNGLTTVEYAYLAEEMGKAHLGAETFNCSAPDTGNMEGLDRFHAEHKKQWLEPLLNGEIRSAYLMTEPDVASSDATNMSMACVRDGDDYVLNGEKWWASGAGDPRCAIYIVMVRTGGDDTPKHARHSMILVPADTAGIEKLRPMQVYGQDDAPHGHFHIRFTDVRVPGEQSAGWRRQGLRNRARPARTGPHPPLHARHRPGRNGARADVQARARPRGLRQETGPARRQLRHHRRMPHGDRMARLLCLKAAWMMDQGDARAAAPFISQIKVVAPRVSRSRSPTRQSRCSADRAFPRTRRWPACGRICARCAWPMVPTLSTAARSRAPNSSATPRKRSDPAMKAIICPDYGPVSNLEYRDMPEPKPGKGEVVIGAEAIGVNYPDGLLVQGLYQMKPETPFIPGMEAGGRIERRRQCHQPQARRPRRGHDRSRRLCAEGPRPSNRVFPLPDRMTYDDACALMCAWGTSHHALASNAQPEAGRNIAGAWRAGSTGLAAISIGKAIGARVIAVASTTEKRRPA